MSESPLPSFDVFYEEIFSLFPKGNPNEAHNELCYQIAVGNKTIDGHLIRLPFIKQKWKEYIDLCTSQGRDEKFVKSFKSWMSNKDYLVKHDVKLKPTKSLIRRRTKE
jgi:hypothetical protein